MASSSTRLQGEILNFIRERHFESGERLFSEREFAEKFGTTRSSVREAFTALEALRVVERRPQAGIFLRDLGSDSSIDTLVIEVNAGLTLDLKQAEDAGEVRSILEVTAARIAAERRTDEDLDAIRRILETTEARIEKAEPINFEDEEFHKAIVASTGNSLLLRVVNWFYEFTRAKRALYFLDVERSKTSFVEHKLIFEALEKGDSELCAKLMKEHLSHSNRIWLSDVEAGTESPA